MSFYELLKKKLDDIISKKRLLELLPRSYNMVGKVLLVKIHPELEPYKERIGEAMLDITSARTVCIEKGILGEKRKPQIEVIAGNGTETLHREHGCLFAIDVAKLMWAKGNKSERIRLISLVKPGEIIVDMFAGIGYFSIPIAKYCQVKKIYAIDKNPTAIKYLQKNVFLNKVENKIEILKGDCRSYANLLENIASRVIMGFLFETEKFLPAALKIAGDNCIIHYHFLARKDDTEKEIEKVKKIARENFYRVKVLLLRKVKSYAPKVCHWVMDLEARKA
jgi:tRNA wybutosine-synthesizing protein 2